jgi:hypothetical protein
MAKRLTLKEFRRIKELTDSEEWEGFVSAALDRGRGPALCSEGCQVEADCECEHGNPAMVVLEGYYA